MPKKVEEMLYILCPSRAYLYPAKIMGPIVHPLKLSKTAVIQLLMSGAEVYEFIPKTKKTIKLTLGNINNPNRYESAIETTEVEEKPVEPVVRKGVPNLVTIDASSSEEESDTAFINGHVQSDPVIFEYNEDGTVDESKIEWSKYSKNERKEIRRLINEKNESLNK